MRISLISVLISKLIAKNTVLYLSIITLFSSGMLKCSSNVLLLYTQKIH